MEPQKNILIRDLSRLQQTQLEELKESTREKTASRAILRMLAEFKDLKERLNTQYRENGELIRENRLLSETIESIRFQISCIPEKK